MAYRFFEWSFSSSDGVHTVHAQSYVPENKQPRAVIQLSHGMIDHIGRYGKLAEALTDAGFILAGNDHLGHGKTAGSKEDLGFFTAKNGTSFVLRDLHAMNQQLHENYPDLPVFLLGHSMGSFLARMYTVRYPRSINGLILLGTGGKDHRIPFGKALAATASFFCGKRHRSVCLGKMAFSGYNSHFPKEEGDLAWLTRDAAALGEREGDPYVGFWFTTSALLELFRMVGASNARSFYKTFPQDLPTLIVSGTADPVGKYGKGPKEVYRKLDAAGVGNLTIKLYDDARHELFNETNREEFFDDLIGWIGAQIV